MDTCTVYPIYIYIIILFSKRDLGLELFGSLIITKPRIQERVLKGVLAAIQRER